ETGPTYVGDGLSDAALMAELKAKIIKDPVNSDNVSATHLHCIEKAFGKLPSNIGHLLHEVPKWFSKSVICREAFKELFRVMDAKEERKDTPLPFQKFSFRGKVIYNILLNWKELKGYFAVVVPKAGLTCRDRAREFLGMLKDPFNLLYFHFLSPIVTEFERVNSLFQTTDADPEELVIESRKVDEVKRLCAGLLIEALKQVESRLPASTGISKGLSAFAPRKVLSQTERVPFKDLSLPHLRSEKESVFDGKIPTGATSFWSGVLQYKNSTGKRPFEELGTYAMACLTTPTSNAVERIFSTVTNVKTNSRNRLCSEMLGTIISVRSHLQFQGKCCRDFKVTPHMMDLFNSANMSEKEEPGDDDELD
ncbi:hypothetical protein Hamer_G027703, partial [Homarus americanus]